MPNKTFIDKSLEQAKHLFTSEEDIISVIEEDHKPLKELIKVMQDGDKAAEERIDAFKQFAPLLVTHAKAEEKSLYQYMKSVQELREDAFEGDTEHTMADQLCEEIERTRDPDEMLAKIKVLAEAVEHHIKEEEDEMFPHVKKLVDAQVLKKLTKTYFEVQAEVISEGQDDSPREAELETEKRH
jgi:hemerythrin superfamily protein